MNFKPLYALLLASPCLATVPAAYPNLDKASSQASLVVALPAGSFDVDGGDCAKGISETKLPDGSVRVSMCLSFPIGMHFDVQQTLFGTAAPGRHKVFSYSHYGTEPYRNNPGRWLVLITSDGTASIMPKYANAALLERAPGDWYLPASADRPLYWLPCSVSALREPIDWESISGPKPHTKVTHAISLSALELHLRYRPLRPADFQCSSNQAE